MDFNDFFKGLRYNNGERDYFGAATTQHFFKENGGVGNVMNKTLGAGVETGVRIGIPLGYNLATQQFKRGDKSEKSST
ncbi:MAG: hypothetical protein M0T74_08180 [Desulfitobacterium hafniense]|nr:hypothetical protein [Desulfitobacterium hafniense]